MQVVNHLVGGVNSPVRSFSYVGFKNIPVFVGAEGCYLYDKNGNKYIDFISGWGSQILGYNTSVYKEIFGEFKKNNLYFVGATNPYEIELAKIICQAIPGIEKVRIMNSGTEAVMTALRLARAITGRDLILKFEGCYHGHVDYMLFKAGSGVMTHSISTSQGIPEILSKSIIVVPFNDIDAIKKLYPALKNRLAAVILEGIPANMGIVIPKKGFLEELFSFTRELGALVILDEIVTGFRVCFGGLQNLLGLKPDITTLGKIVGGGFPIGIVGSSEEIMSNLSPIGRVYQAGTFSGNPLSTFAGVKVLNYLRKNRHIYRELRAKSDILVKRLKEVFKRKGYRFTINKYGSLFSFFPGVDDYQSYTDAQKVDKKLFEKLYKYLYRNKVLLPPSPFEAIFLNASHSEIETNYVMKVLENI